MIIRTHHNESYESCKGERSLRGCVIISLFRNKDSHNPRFREVYVPGSLSSVHIGTVGMLPSNLVEAQNRECCVLSSNATSKHRKDVGQVPRSGPTSRIPRISFRRMPGTILKLKPGDLVLRSASLLSIPFGERS